MRFATVSSVLALSALALAVPVPVSKDVASVVQGRANRPWSPALAGGHDASKKRGASPLEPITWPPSGDESVEDLTSDEKREASPVTWPPSGDGDSTSNDKREATPAESISWPPIPDPSGAGKNKRSALPVNPITWPPVPPEDLPIPNR